MKWQWPYLLLQPVCNVLGCGAVVLVVVKELPLPKRQKEHENQIVSESRLQQRAEWRLGNMSLKTTAKDVCDLTLFVNITTCITATLLHLILKTHPTQNMPSKNHHQQFLKLCSILMVSVFSMLCFWTYEMEKKPYFKAKSANLLSSLYQIYWFYACGITLIIMPQ